MSATKAYLMSDAGRAAAAARVRAAERRWANLCAACALARGVDAATLALVARDAAREYSAAQELFELADAY